MYRYSNLSEFKNGIAQLLCTQRRALKEADWWIVGCLIRWSVVRRGACLDEEASMDPTRDIQHFKRNIATRSTVSSGSSLAMEIKRNKIGESMFFQNEVSFFCVAEVHVMVFHVWNVVVIIQDQPAH